MRFLIIWPERRYVSEDTIRTWYADMVADDEAENPNLTDSYDMAKELENIGRITMGRCGS